MSKENLGDLKMRGVLELVDDYPTLRDQFAMHATMDDLKVQFSVMRANSDIGILPDNYIAIARYMHADAMLAARKNEKGGVR